MPTYKDVEPIIKELENLRNELGISIGFISLRERMALKKAIKIINAAPAADVAPVVHGKWIDNPEDVREEWNKPRKQCSACGNEPEYIEGSDKYVLSDFCANCGARMDKEKRRRTTASGGVFC